MSGGNYAGINLKLPTTVTDLSKCKSVKFTVKMSEATADDVIKLTFAAIHKDATSNYDETLDDHGRIVETYADVKYKATSQQDNITYDATTDEYTLTFSLVDASNLDKVGYLMLARNGSTSKTAKVTITQIDYTMKADGEADPTDAYPFLTVPFTQNYNDAQAGVATSAAFMLPGGVAVSYKETDGVEGSGCVLVPADTYNGPAVLLDNRKGAADKDFYVEAMVKAVDDASIDGIVEYYGAYSSFAGAVKQGTTFDSQYLKTTWNKMHDKVTVPQGGFVELRFKGNKAFLLDNIKIDAYTNQNITDDDYPEKEPVDRVSVGAVVTADIKNVITSGSSGYTLSDNPNGTLITLEKQYSEAKFALSTPVMLAACDSITAQFSSTSNIALKYYDEDGNAIADLVRYSKTSDTTTGRDTWTNKVWNGVDLSKKIAYIGFMANDGAVTDLLVKSVTTTPATKIYADLAQDAVTGSNGQTVTSITGGAIQVGLEKQYSELKLALPLEVSLLELSNITVSFTSSENIALKYYDADGNPIDSLIRYGKKAETVTASDTWNDKVWNDVDLSTKVKYVGLMANDGKVDDLVVTGIYMTPATSFVADLSADAAAGSNGQTVTAGEGGYTLALAQQYSEWQIALPTALTLGEIKSIDVAFTSTENLALKFYDADGNQIEKLVRYSKKSDTSTGISTWTDKLWNDADLKTEVAYVGIMANDGAVTDALIKSITVNKNIVSE